MAVSSPIVVPEASSMVWISFWSVWRAVCKAELEDDDDESSDDDVLAVSDVAVVLAEVLAVLVCATAAWCA